MERLEVAIVGGGVMGAATAWALSKRGVDAVVFEQFAPGHDRGSSHGPTRVFRFAYEDPFYVRMAQQSLPLWRELEDVAGRALLTTSGGMDVGVDADRTFDALRSCGAAAERLDARAIVERFGFASSGPGVFSPDTGVLAASAALAALLDAASLPVRAQARVTGLSVGEDEVTFAVNGDAVRARRCVCTAGAWTGPLLAAAGVSAPLGVTREQVFYFAGGESLPVVIDRGERFCYLVPAAHGAPGAKAGEHGAGERTTADGRSFDIDPEGEARVCDWIDATFPSLSAEPVAAETCLYTNTPDENFVIDARGPLTFASPCSGHGFKFAPLIGEILADLALGAPPSFDPSRFALSGP